MTSAKKTTIYKTFKISLKKLHNNIETIQNKMQIKNITNLSLI